MAIYCETKRIDNDNYRLDLEMPQQHATILEKQ